MKCPTCETENLDSKKFCRRCGANLRLICPQCGVPALPDDNFCGDCGYDLKEPKESSPIDFDLPRSYTPKHLADKILSTRSSIQGERKLVTVMFADVAGSTAMFERLDPEEVHRIMDGCFKILLEQIHRYEGTINQFRGDGIMALFGAPIAHEDHAQRACHAALAIQRALVLYSEQLKRTYGIDFRMRIGLNSGEVVVGAIGDDLRMDYTAQGDTANLAARMESTTEPGTIQVAPPTYEVTRDFFDFECLGRTKLKGKQEPVHTYLLQKPSRVATRIAAAAARGLTGFVDRTRELESLKDAFEAVRQQQGRVVSIVGEAGSGKSRLLLEFKNMIPGDEYIYLEGHCLHYGHPVPYLPIIDAFKTYLGIEEGESESSIKEKIVKTISGLGPGLRSVFASVQDLFSLKVDDEDFLRLEPERKRERIFEAIRNVLLVGSQSKPMVVAIEDLQWIDKTTEELLDYLIRWIPNSNILMILLYRPEYFHHWAGKSYYTSIGVNPLSAPVSAELVRANLGSGNVVPEILELVFVQTSGNPFFVEELTRTLLANGTIAVRQNGYMLTCNPANIAIPDSIYGIIAARIDRIEENLKKTLQIASVVGREFGYRILYAVTGNGVDLKGHLLSLQGQEYIYEKSLLPDLVYVFRHALTQEVAYNSLLVEKRKEIHEKTGDAIEKLYPHRREEFCERLAYHYSRADNVAKATYYLKLSADKAKRNWSNWEAFRFLREADAILKQELDTHENKRLRLEILHDMAPTLRMLGYPQGSLDFLKEGETLAKELGDLKALAWLQGYIGLYYAAWANQPSLGTQYIDDSQAAAEESQDAEMIVLAIVDRVLICAAQGLFKDICHIAPKGISLINDIEGQHNRFGRAVNNFSLLLGHYGMSMAALGEFDAGEQFLLKGHSFAREINDYGAIAATEACYGWFFFFKGDGHNAEKHFRVCIEYAGKSQLGIILGPAWGFLGLAYILKSEPEKATTCFEKALKTQSDSGIPLWSSFSHLGLAEARLRLGNIEEARRYAERALELSAQNKERFAEALGKLTLARVLGHSAESRFEEASGILLQSQELFAELKVRPMLAVSTLYRAELDALVGENKRSLDGAKVSQEMFREMEMNYWTERAREFTTKLSSSSDVF